MSQYDFGSGGMHERFGRCPCGKVSFDKKSALTKKNDFGKRGNGAMRIYQCDQSDFWHLTKLFRYKK